jgi:hypothetical protein
MFAVKTNLSIDVDTGGPNKDAVDGLGAIVVALDRGLDAGGQAPTVKFGDIFAIGLGWLVLVAVIAYPVLQLAVLAAGILFLGSRSIVRIILGPSVGDLRGCGPLSHTDRHYSGA